MCFMADTDSFSGFSFVLGSILFAGCKQNTIEFFKIAIAISILIKSVKPVRNYAILRLSFFAIQTHLVRGLFT